MAEDEANLCHLLRPALVLNQHNVLVAVDSEKAVDIFNRHEKKIGVLLLDIGLPPMGGLKVIQQIRARNPSIPIVVTTLVDI